MVGVFEKSAFCKYFIDGTVIPRFTKRHIRLYYQRPSRPLVLF